MGTGKYATIHKCPMTSLIRTLSISNLNIEDKVAFKGSTTNIEATGEIDIDLEFVNWRKKSLTLPNSWSIIESALVTMTTPAPVDLNSVEKEAQELHYLQVTNWTDVLLISLSVLAVAMAMLWLWSTCRDRRRHTPPSRTSVSRRGSCESVKTEVNLKWRGKKRGSKDYASDEVDINDQPPQPLLNFFPRVSGKVLMEHHSDSEPQYK